jgi:hypothetical protein
VGYRLILPSVRLFTCPLTPLCVFCNKTKFRLYLAVSSAKPMLASMLAFPSHTVNREQEQGEGGGVVTEDKDEIKEGARSRRIKELGENRLHLQPRSLYSYVLCALRVCTCTCAPRIKGGAPYCNQP